MAEISGRHGQFYTAASYDLALAMARMLGTGFSTNTDEGLVAIYDAALPIQLQVAGGFVDGYTDQYGNSGYGLAALAIHVASSEFPSPLGDASAWLAYPGYITADLRYEYGGVYMVRATVSEVAEPGTGLLALLGCAGLAACSRRKCPTANR